MILLDGKTLSQKILSGLNPHGELHIILVGEDPSSIKYVALKQHRCAEIGIICTIHHLPADTPEKNLLELINKLNNDAQVTGFFIQLPLPLHLNRDKILNLIDPQKDVDGLTDKSPYTPAVVRGVVRLLDEYQLLDAGKTAVIVNDSKLIGLPLKNILVKRGLKVDITNKFTQNLPKICRGADILFSATGVKGLITGDYINPGAVVVDIGGGDVEFASVAEKTSYITPTVGGVGPMTVACLLENLVNGPES